MRRCPTTVGSANATRSVLITAYVLLDERRLIVPAQPRVTSVALVEHGLQLALVVTVDPPPNRWVVRSAPPTSTPSSQARWNTAFGGAARLKTTPVANSIWAML
jgi:hypothetical protein